MISSEQRIGLVAQLLEKKRELDMLMFDEDMTEPPSRPATEKDIARFEKLCGFPMEPSYRAFLLLHDGWINFDGDAAILGTKGSELEWFEETLEMVWEVFEDFGDENPIDDAVPVVLGEDTNNYLFMWPPEKGSDEAATFREYEHGKLTRSYRDFDEYLTEFLQSLQETIEIEREGPEGGDDDGQ
ncbi:MAG: SMI1/KNR4 family protein [Mesorhizobium sp.]|uniref:SMI1/KNR4 family protein n=1 Tax=Mesorhizobium sp. TaxID=1871066 RepID=UPI000FE79C0B|nr:SMI1/KNR4 family protein [Mesorhizobium sp.]RWP24101.1 MAG: SMI1/KNR4 family protein [Mesorhizobium sp.]